jgi:hypothetical protein
MARHRCRLLKGECGSFAASSKEDKSKKKQKEIVRMEAEDFLATSSLLPEEPSMRQIA